MPIQATDYTAVQPGLKDVAGRPLQAEFDLDLTASQLP